MSSGDEHLTSPSWSTLNKKWKLVLKGHYKNISSQVLICYFTIWFDHCRLKTVLINKINFTSFFCFYSATESLKLYAEFTLYFHLVKFHFFNKRLGFLAPFVSEAATVVEMNGAAFYVFIMSSILYFPLCFCFKSLFSPFVMILSLTAP